MKIETTYQWHCRKAGGLFLGFRVYFVTNNYDLKYHSKNITVSFGFLFFTLNIAIRYNFVKGLPQ